MVAMVYVSCPLIWFGRPAFSSMYMFTWKRFLVSQLIKVTWLYYLSCWPVLW
jgi:hypothetical protein